MGEVTILRPADPSPLQLAPKERAEQRLSVLKTSFSTVVQTVAEMYRDKDWRHLNRADGSAYESMTPLLMDVLEVSAPMARRYLQGARGLYLPLAGLLAEGATIEVRSGDIAVLGETGMREVLATVEQRVVEVSDPREQSAVVREAITEERERRAASRREEFDDDGGAAEECAPGFGDDESWSSGEPQGAPRSTTGVDTPFVDTVIDPFEGRPDPMAPAAVPDLVDPADRAMSAATSLRDATQRARLEEPLRSVVAALVTLAEMDPPEVARLVDESLLGALEPVNDALAKVSQMRAIVETQPWFLSLL